MTELPGVSSWTLSPSVPINFQRRLVWTWALRVRQGVSETTTTTATTRSIFRPTSIQTGGDAEFDSQVRAAWRREQFSVRMALAAAQHHAGPKCVGPETPEALRGQTTSRAAEKRPAPLAEVSGPHPQPPQGELEKKEEEEARRRERDEAEYEARMLELDFRVDANDQLTQAESHAWRKWAGHQPAPFALGNLDIIFYEPFVSGSLVPARS